MTNEERIEQLERKVTELFELLAKLSPVQAQIKNIANDLDRLGARLDVVEKEN
jgi:hypothetical protein